MTTLLLVAATTLVAGTEDVQRYHNYSVYRLKPNNVFQVAMINDLQEVDGVDFWREADQVNRIADMMLSPEAKETVLQKLDDLGINYEVIISDVEQRNEAERQQRFDTLFRPHPLARGAVDNKADAIPDFWKTYQRYDRHVALVDALVAQNPAIASKLTIGKSSEKRDIVAIRIGVNGGSASKKVIWIEGGIHAREWISPATVTYFAQQLVNKYQANDDTVKDLLGYFDIIIVPSLNVDGYEYTHTNSRLWRKTRGKNSGSTCIGADPNRNFGYQWGGTGASSNPCSETYRGDKAHSEVEVLAETDYIVKNFKGRISSFLSVHSYGQYWLYPWGYTSNVTPDDKELNRVAKAAVAALNKVTPSTKYTIGTSTNVLYAAAGGADDWSYGNASAKFSYTVELRDTGTYGFQLPANQIIPTGEETTAAFIALAVEVKKSGA